MSRQTLEEKSAELEDLKNLIISVTDEAVEKALANAPFPSEKYYKLQEAISTELIKNRAFLEAVLSVIRCEKIEQ